MNQLELHKQVDDIVRNVQDLPRADFIRELLDGNVDARNYFFATAPTSWASYLLEKKLLDAIYSIPKDPTRYSYTMPELGYLERVAEDTPGQVVGIMQSVTSTSDAFNPEVLDRFLSICGRLPAEDIVYMVSKIRDEEWIRLMKDFSRWGFEYGAILKKLFDDKEFAAFLTVAEAVLSVRSVDEMRETTRGFSLDTPFNLSDLSYTKVFDYLVEFDESHLESALNLVSTTLAEVVMLEGKEPPTDLFEMKDSFSLYEVDFFTLEVGSEKHLGGRDDVRDLAATVSMLSQKLLAANCDNPTETRRIYESQIDSLPNSQAMHRLRMYAMSLCPQVFKDEIKAVLFRIFEHENFWGILAGAEYKRLIKKCFFTLDKADQRAYVEKAIELFSKDENSANTAVKIFSCAYELLTKEESDLVEKKFGKLDSAFEPEASISEPYAGTVVPQSPEKGELWGGNVNKIVEALKKDLAPEVLAGRSEYDKDILRPENAEGVGDELRRRMIDRPKEFLENAVQFFDREKLNSHYTYSFLRGAHELLKDKQVDGIDLIPLNSLLEAVRDSGLANPFGTKSNTDHDDGWLANWIGVHRVMTDVVCDLMSDRGDSGRIDFIENRDSLFATIGYLLGHSDPTRKEDNVETASSKVKGPGQKEYTLGDPYSTAINTVRGQAFDALTSFVFLDGKRLESEGVKIADDVKGLYEKVLRQENTQAIMFMFGRYLPSFYFRDMKWLRGLVPEIFSIDIEKKDLYIAAWEGFISNNLFEEIFKDEIFIKLYERALNLSEDEYTRRRYFRDLDSGLAVHIALAFVHYDDFGFDSPLFKAFWKKKNDKRHSEFISFIGRKYLSGRNRRTEMLEKEEFGKDNVMALWDWVLARDTNLEVLANFGYWINIENNILEIPWLADRVRQTVDKTGGEIEWELGLQQSIAKLASSAPDDTLVIMRKHILDWGVGAEEKQKFFFMRDDWIEAFRILHNNPTTKEGTVSLINDLILKGGRRFWDLKNILKSESK